MVKLLTDMFAKALLVMSKLVVRSFAKNVGLVGVEFAEVSGEAPRQNVSEGIVDDSEVDGKASRHNSTKASNCGSLNFQ